MIHVLDLKIINDINEYNNLLLNFNNDNPYYQFDFIKLFNSNSGNLISFVYYNELNECKIVMPGYLSSNKIGNDNVDYFHFSTPYGYTGPLISNSTYTAVIKKFWEELNEWYIKYNVVSEFIRFDLFKNFEFYDGNLHSTMLNIKGKIFEEQTQWKSFDHKVRKNVNKAISEGLKCKIFYLAIPEIEIEKFYDIYIKTMIRTNANKSFFFNLSDFKNYILNNLNFNILCNIYDNENVISSELALVSNDTIYSFLGGTDENYFHKRPNDFLKFELINWARRNNKNYFILGGGVGYEDGIFKYKKSFFPNDVVTYYTGRKIVNPEKYIELLNFKNKIRISNLLKPLSIDDDTFFPIFNKLD